MTFADILLFGFDYLDKDDQTFILFNQSIHYS